MDEPPHSDNEGESHVSSKTSVQEKVLRDSGSTTSSTKSSESETCDDLINGLVEKNKTLEAEAEAEVHQEDCPLYEEKIIYLPAKPCPPGARPCCTCLVCPLDLINNIDESKGEGEGEGEGEGDDYGLDKWGKHKQSVAFHDLSDMGDMGDKYGYEFGFGFGFGMGASTGLMKGEGDFEYSISSVSRHEGSVFEDYMKLILKPICYRTLSSLSSSYVSCEEPALQRTIVIVKPDAVRFKEAIYRAIFEAGFQILGVRVLHLTPEEISEIYSKYYGSPAFVHLVVTVSEAPVLAISISGMNVIKRWINMIGLDGSLRAEWFYPLSMKKLFGLHDTHSDWIHGSENLKASNKENRYFYPNAIIEPIINEEDKVTDYCSLNINKILTAACAEVVKKRPVDPILFVADYLLLHNPFQPRFPTKIALIAT